MTTKKTRKPRRVSLGWTFTPEEERMARRAIREANRYMSRYGKGTRTPDIDLSHYDNRIITKDKTTLSDSPQHDGLAGA